jgi:hypothetical protein
VQTLDAIALAALGLIVLTTAHASLEPERSARREWAMPREAPATGSSRCALYHARFGGRRAQLIRVTQGSVRNYVIVEHGKRDPATRALKSSWLSSAYGMGESVWLGEYHSAEAAIVRAVELCPPAQRCWGGETGCGPKEDTLTPAELFLRSTPASALKM